MSAPVNEKVELNVAPGSVVHVRDEEWLVTGVEQTGDGLLIRVRGLSELVRDTTAAFYKSLDDIEVIDPAEAIPVADASPNYRRARLWLESTLRKTPIPQDHEGLTVSTRMLADKLEYQRIAVARALDPQNVRPRILIADAVGLGKTLEIGMILSELARRGRAERVLVVTPRHVLEQMQHELWCRFALPFVRLDSAGIQKVRQTLPATRNPFTYFKRAIISIDTLKSARYKAHLQKIRWDAVVIDESHNLTNAGTLNNELARILAPNTEALILASATPHNGKPESFAELIRLLDPTAIRPDGTFDAKDIQRLIIRRHRHSPEVASEVGANWMERLEPDNRLIAASPAENAVAQEIADTWLYPQNGSSPYSGANSSLFPWTLAKAFLSSPAALLETVKERLRKVADPKLPAEHREHEALERLRALTEESLKKPSAKYQELARYLKEIGVGPKSNMRAVVFAERVPTLRWLEQHLPKDLGLKRENVRILHGGLSDVEQQEIVESFKQEASPIRVLVTGDVASEGVNLHSQCHHLIHFDIPWSLIRIEQRNGRIDRYGQKKNPQITTLLLHPDHEMFAGDLKVITRLMEREHVAHGALNDVASLMGLHSVEAEQKAILAVLAGKQAEDQVVRTVEDVLDPAHTDDGAFDDFDSFFEQLTADDGGRLPQVPTDSGVGLYSSELDYLDDALHEAFGAPEEPPSNGGGGGVSWKVHSQHQIAELVPRRDLQQRLAHLPQGYLNARRVTEKLKLATTLDKGQNELDAAKNAILAKGEKATTWPEAHFLGPLHPVLEWASDRALASMSGNEVPVVRADVEEPSVVLMGTLMNRRGQVISQAFFATQGGELCIPEQIEDLAEYLRAIGFTEKSINSGPVAGTESYRPYIGRAVRNTTGSLDITFDAAAQAANQRLDEWHRRADAWGEVQGQAQVPGMSTRRLKEDKARVEQEQEIVSSLAPDRRLVRPLLVVVPLNTPAEGEH
ncbi:helicase [Pseudarthrobacter phenanthrenivorans]|uniref:Helicase n=1 Tax=Pseudarthrobacter phenanthrenivorans TaxID=361575 RepID=A0A3B0FWV5_PSEPS|nr:helicase-related protein [Pseudarthrobacter phenanthrenivorans]RKO26131.1 helicase [Pseudarthrobacter phenanthrenivorans]